jgi:hypothetical protein
MPGPRLPIELFPESDTPEFDGPNGVTPERPTGEGIDAAELDAERGTGSSLGGFFFNILLRFGSLFVITFLRLRIKNGRTAEPL